MMIKPENFYTKHELDHSWNLEIKFTEMLEGEYLQSNGAYDFLVDRFLSNSENGPDEHNSLYHHIIEIIKLWGIPQIGTQVETNINSRFSIQEVFMNSTDKEIELTLKEI